MVLCSGYLSRVINQIINPSIIPSTDVIQLSLTLKMTTAQVVETSVTVNNKRDYVHPDDQTQPFEMTPAFKPFTRSRNLQRNWSSSMKGFGRYTGKQTSRDEDSDT